MRRYILSIVALLGVAMTSCEQHTAESNGYGLLELSGIGVSVEEITRATSTDNFVVSLSKASGEQVDSWTLGEMPQTVELRAGSYRVNVASAANHAAVSREGYFVGGDTFDIVAGQTTTPDPVTCKLESLKVSVEFEGEILEAMGADCQTTVSLADANITVAATDNAPIYFRPQDVRNTLKVVFEGTVDGAAERFTTEIAGVRVGQWRHIVIKMTYEDGERVLSASIAPWSKDENIYVE